MQSRSRTRRYAALAGAAFAVLFAGAATAETLDEVLAKYYEARGGVAKWTAATTLSTTGKMLMGEMEAPFTVRMKRPNKMRVDFTVMGLTGSQAFDGEDGWMLMPFTGKKDPEPLDADAVKELKQRSDFDGPLFGWKAKGNKVDLAGKEKVEGTDAWKLSVMMPDSSMTYVYLDAESFLEIKQTGKRTINGNEIEAEEYPSDYKDVDGLIIPMTIETKIKGMDQTQKMMFATATLNEEIADDVFVMPAIQKATEGAPEPKGTAKEVESVPVPAEKKPGAKKKP